VRLGIGHPGHKDRVAGYVLHDFAKADQEWLDDVLHGISDGIGQLVDGHGDKFLNLIALRVAPARSSASKPAKAPAPPPAGAAPPEDTSSAICRW
jgi:PTH1 family peptidyl-tRNA hydrolase